MEEKDIMMKDLGSLFKILKIFGSSLIRTVPWMYRWLSSVIISAVIIKTFEINELIILNGWINLTLYGIALLIYFGGFLFHQSYALDKHFNKLLKSTSTSKKEV